MRSSSLGTLALVVLTGCTAGVATPPIPAATVAPAQPSTSSGGPQSATASAARSAWPAGLDPSEEITPKELATIPDPVPDVPPAATSAPAAAASASVAATSAPAAAASASVAATSAGKPGVAPENGRGWVWRVQVFASPDLAQADRIAKEAGARFGEPWVIEYEGSLYKVRLGAFATESLAQALRERAVQEGYPGAFRMRSSARDEK